MPRFEWHHLTVVVGEMNRTSALSVARDFDVFLSLGEALDELTVADYLGTLFLVSSPVSIWKGSERLPDGVHTFDVDGVPVTLQLPLTADIVRALPASLSGQMINAADTANIWLSTTFTSVLLAAARKKTDRPPLEGLPSKALNDAG